MNEKHQYKLYKSPHDTRDIVIPFTLDVPLPSKIDLRPKLPPVLNQGNLGSCASNAASSCIRYLLKKEGLPEFQPSRLYIYYNTRVNIAKAPQDKDTGVCIRDICKSISKYHACDEKIWPYIIKKFSTAPSLEAYKNADLFKNVEYSFVPLSIDLVKSLLTEGYPIITGLVIYESFESDYVMNTGDIPLPDKTKEKMLGGHALLIVGFDDSTQKLLLLNSWGKHWGKDGYCELPYSYFLDKTLCLDNWALKYFG